MTNLFTIDLVTSFILLNIYTKTNYNLLNQSLHSFCPWSSGNILDKKSVILSFRAPPVLCAAVTKYNLYRLYSSLRTAITNEYMAMY